MPIHILPLPEDPVSFIHKNTAMDGTWCPTSSYVPEKFNNGRPTVNAGCCTTTGNLLL